MIVRVLSLLLAAGGSLDLILGAGFSQLSVSFKNLEVICSAQLGLDKKHFRPVFPSTGSSSITLHSYAEYPDKEEGGGGCWGWGVRRGICLLSLETIQCPWPAWATPPSITVSCYSKCCARGELCAVVQPALVSNMEHRVCH